jgi:hypothetical protein
MAARKFFSSALTGTSAELDLPHNSSTPPLTGILLSTSSSLAVDTGSYYDTSEDSLRDDGPGGHSTLNTRDGGSVCDTDTFLSIFLSK